MLCCMTFFNFPKPKAPVSGPKIKITENNFFFIKVIHVPKYKTYECLIFNKTRL